MTVFVHVCVQVHVRAGVYILENTPPPPPGEGKISADGIWGKKYEKAKRKWGNVKGKGRKGKKKEEKGKKMRKRAVKG